MSDEKVEREKGFRLHIYSSLEFRVGGKLIEIKESEPERGREEVYWGRMKDEEWKVGVELKC